jgi:transcriptional regulator with XRE-family HTH domain
MIDINNPNNHVADMQTPGGGWTTPFSRWLSEQRTAKGISHEQMASLLNMTVDTYRLYEVGRGSQAAPSRVKYKHFTVIAKALGIERDHLMKLCGLVPPMSINQLAKLKQENSRSSRLKTIRSELDSVVESIGRIVAQIKELEDEDRRTVSRLRQGN